MCNCQSASDLLAMADKSRCDTSQCVEPTWNKRCDDLLARAYTCPIRFRRSP